MTLKNSCFKGGARRGIWATVLSAVSLLLIQLLPTVMTIQNGFENVKVAKSGGWYDEFYWESTVSRVTGMLSSNAAVSVILTILAVVCGVAGFQYLHSRQKVDFYHSLPISRTQLFFSNYASGILRVLPAYYIVMLLSVACTYALGMGEAVVWAQIGASVLSNTVVFLLLYSMSALATILCGNTIIALLLLLWIQLAPMAVLLLQNGLCSYFFKTYVFNDGTNAVLFTPIMAQFLLGSDAASQDAMQRYLHVSLTSVLLIYVAAFLIISALALFAFRVRKSERAGTAISFEPLKMPVKVFMCAVVGLTFGLFLGVIGTGVWLWVGIVLGTVIMHALAEMIYAFDFRAGLKKPLHLVLVLAALIVLALGMKNDVLGFDRYVPAVDKLTGVNLSTDYSYGGGGEEKDFLRSAENIAAVQRLAEISMYENAAEAGGRHYQVQYRLQGGKIVTRNLFIPKTEETKALREQVFLSEEYKLTQWDLFRYDPAQYRENYLQVEDGIMQTRFDDTEKISKIISTLREEAMARSAAAKPVTRFWVNGNDDGRRNYYSANMIVTDQDVRTLALLKEYAGYEPQAPTPQPVTVYFEDEQSGTATALEITDPADLKLIWEAGIPNSEGSDYLLTQAGIVTEDDDLLWCAAEDSAPMQFVRGQRPTAVLEKYRAQAGKYDDTAVVTGGVATAETVFALG